MIMPHESKDYEELKKRILDIGIAIPGTLREIYHRCGRSYCQCMVSEKHRHGPYFLWDRRINGKLSAKSINEDDVVIYKEWINNRKKLEELVAQMLSIGQNYAAARSNLKKSDMANSAKITRSMRGK
jgi:hypothetical protein